jgi:hypothetical protein
MKKKLCFLLIGSLLLVTLFLGCSSPTDGEGFAIYLTRDNIPPSQMEALSHVDLADQPLVSIDDVVWYLPGAHEIELTDIAYQKLEEMHFPTNGTTFLVCVDRQPVYWGAFWPYYSSQSFDGVIIGAAPFLHTTEGLQNAIQITLGYPNSSFFTGIDPRSNPIIYEALQKAGKLVSA